MIDTRIIKEVQGGYATYEGKTYKKEHQVADPQKYVVLSIHKKMWWMA